MPKKNGNASDIFLAEYEKEPFDNSGLTPLADLDKFGQGSNSPKLETIQIIESPKIATQKIPSRKNSKHSTTNSPRNSETKMVESLIGNKTEENFFSLQALADVMDCIFQNRKPTRRVNLTKTEITILKSIIKRKFGPFPELNSYLEGPVSELYSKLQELNSTKRPEENYKFIFKRCLKQMKEQFKEDNPVLAKRKDLDKCFYEHYFKTVSENLKISIDNFYHPKNSKAKNKSGPKTINNTYIQNICKSKAFKKDFSEYLDKNLLKEYQESIKLKNKNLIARWSKELKASGDRKDASGVICDYIENNKKCKLPWSVKEVTEAIRSVNHLFDLVNQKVN